VSERVRVGWWAAAHEPDPYPQRVDGAPDQDVTTLAATPHQGVVHPLEDEQDW